MSSIKIVYQEIMSIIDYACVSFKTNETDIELAALVAEKHGVKTILVNPIYVSLLKKFCREKDIDISVASTVAYPIGAYPPEIKRKEIDELIRKGADEIYMLMAVGLFLDCNYLQIEEEMNVMVDASKGRTTKYIIEAGLLDESQKERICNMAFKAGIDYIVTSANFARNKIQEPSLSDIESLLRKTTGKMGLVHFCDIQSKEQVEELKKIGVSRICTESVLKILANLA